jgi:2-oxo-4-hydroxy-4-carboxy-5-ureidoimidazoline decarboxylase
MINKINKLSQSEFIKVFANIFENSTWIANELYKQKPFNNFEELSSKMLDIFENTSKKKQLIILNAHPDLADKTKISSLTPNSKVEQIDVGLDQCTEDEFREFKDLNDKYKKKFGFPFIYAVKNKSKKEILSNFRQRISYDISLEFIEAKKQVKKIASLRLNETNKK